MPSAAPASSLRPTVWASLLLVAAATAARAWLHFRTPLAPGINGAYYFVQARAVLEHGLPGVPDLPLTFWVHAGLAWLVQHLGGLAREPAIVLAVKSADSFLPALTALPIAWLGWRWQRTAARPSLIAVLAPAVFVALGAQALSMTGDFEKNSLALLWLATLAPTAHVFLTRPGWKTALAPLTLLALLGLTHVGVLGASLIFTALLAAGATVSADKSVRRRILALALGGTLILAAAGTIIYRTFDPGRVTRLVKAFAEPSTFIDTANAGSNRGPMLPGGGPAGGPPGGMRAMRWAPSAALLGLGCAGLGLAWYRRKSLPPADRTVLAAAAITVVVLGGPFYGMDKAERLMLIAAVPAAMTLSFILAAITRDPVRRMLGALVIAGTLASTAFYLPHGGRPTISEATHAELLSLARFTTPAEHSLVVARHGLEWWTAWTLHTHIAQPQAVKAADWTKFDRVLYLTEKNRSGPPGGGIAFGPGAPFLGARPQPGEPNDDDMGPPNGPPPGGPPMGFPGGPGGGPDRMAAQIPANATTLHDGDELKLALAPTPPEKASGTRPALPKQ